MRTDIAFREELILHRKSKRIIQKDWHPGCTAVTALIVRNKLFVANAGDCRAILGRNGKPFPLTKVGINLSISLLHFFGSMPSLAQLYFQFVVIGSCR